jgi:hypothetical protein
MTSPLYRAARARGDDQHSRTVLIESLKIAAQIAVDKDVTPTARTRAIAELRYLAKQLDDLDEKHSAEAAISWATIARPITAV